MPRKYPALRPTPQTKDLPATQGMLYLVRTELKADINGLRSELKGEIAAVRSELKTEIAAVGAEVTRLGHQMETSYEKMTAEITRIAVTVEQQNSRNQVVLEALTGLFERQDRVEKKMDECEQTVRSIARAYRGKTGAE